MKYSIDIRDMCAVQAHCKFWKNICEVRVSGGKDKDVLLLAFPRNFTDRTGRVRTLTAEGAAHGGPQAPCKILNYS